MNILDPQIRLIDALSGWGLREATVKNPGLEVSSDESGRTILGVEVVLRHVPQLTARILLAEPLGVTEPCGALKVDFSPEESNTLYLHDGKSLITYTDGAINDEYVRQLVQTPDITPLVCAVQISEEDHPVGPFVIYDGWHPAAAWLTRAREGLPSRLGADLIKTKHSPLLQLHRG